jgi:hypothetical protein
LTGALTDGVLFRANCFARIRKASFFQHVEGYQMDKIGKLSGGLRRADQIPRRRSEIMKRIVAALATFVCRAAKSPTLRKARSSGLTQCSAATR